MALRVVATCLEESGHQFVHLLGYEDLKHSESIVHGRDAKRWWRDTGSVLSRGTGGKRD
jgi:hypothetical protein